jgi:hypothetical protein
MGFVAISTSEGRGPEERPRKNAPICTTDVADGSFATERLSARVRCWSESGRLRNDAKGHYLP